jgi:DNA-binding XRE family transcriptional regulator
VQGLADTRALCVKILPFASVRLKYLMPEILLPPYGERLKIFRINKGINQSSLEYIGGLAQGSVSRIETSKINPSKETLLRLARALQLDHTQTAKLFCFDRFIIN